MPLQKLILICCISIGCDPLLVECLVLSSYVWQAILLFQTYSFLCKPPTTIISDPDTSTFYFATAQRQRRPCLKAIVQYLEEVTTMAYSLKKAVFLT